jgi:small-conductance mechanosensitive channel
LYAYERSWTTSRLEALENAAAQLVTAYTDSVVTQAEKQILLNALRGRFWSAVWSWMAGALLYTLLLFAFVVGLARSGVDLTSILAKLINPR